MAQALVMVDSSTIRVGKLAEVETAIAELVTFVETNEPRPVAYGVYLDEARTRMTVVQVHPDSASVELHMTIAAPVFARFAGLIDMTSMDVYGTPSPGLLEQLRRKAQKLGNASVAVHDLHTGFARFALR